MESLLNAEVLTLWLRGGLHADGREIQVPPALVGMLRAMAGVRLGRFWIDLIKNEEEIPEEIILETREFLLDLGYRDELVGCLVVAMIYCNIYTQTHPDVPPLATSPAPSILLDVALAVLVGLIGVGNKDTALWLLDHAAKCGSERAAAVLVQYRDAIQGDLSARREIVKVTLPYLNCLAAPIIMDSYWQMGEIYDWAGEIDDQPDVLALRAKIQFVKGRAGDEYEAVEMAVRAAFSGSKIAWDCLEDWRNKGHEELVFDYLLSVGSATLTRDN